MICSLIFGKNVSRYFSCKYVVKTWENPELKDQIAAEARFLRAYFYFDLCRMFGTVPLVLTTEAVNNPRAEAKDLYAQIAEDLKYAIQTLPDKKY